MIYKLIIMLGVIIQRKRDYKWLMSQYGIYELLFLRYKIMILFKLVNL